MGNIAFITTRKHIKSYNVLALLQEINQEKFGNHLLIQEIDGGWKIELPNDVHETGFMFWVHGKRKMGSKHPREGIWWNYTMNVFHNEFALKTDGILSDEGIEEHWKPTKDKWKSYEDYVAYIKSHVKDRKLRNYLINLELKTFPAPF